MSVLVEMSYGEPQLQKRRLQPEQLTYFRFIPLPEKLADAWRWDGLEVRPSGNRGNGFFATRSIKAGLLIPYTGKIRKGDNDGDYIIASAWSDDVQVDAHPELDECKSGYFDPEGDANPEAFRHMEYAVHLEENLHKLKDETKKEIEKCKDIILNQEIRAQINEIVGEKREDFVREQERVIQQARSTMAQLTNTLA